MRFNFEDLAKAFPGNKIHFRVGATNVNKDGSLRWGESAVGIPLAYIDARDVMDRLDEVCGAENWQCRYPFPGCCDIGVNVATDECIDNPDRDRWLWKSNGAGATDIEGEKGQYSDSFKRAAVLFKIGRYLYDMPNVWIPLEKKGKSHVFGKETLKSLSERYDDWALNYFKKLEEK